MKKIIIIPCNEPSYLLKILTNDMSYRGRYKGKIEIHDSPWDTDEEFEAQQLLVISDDDTNVGDIVKYPFGIGKVIDNPGCNGTEVKCLRCTLLDNPLNVGIGYEARFDTLDVYKIVASYPHIPNTLRLSKQKIQEFIDGDFDNWQTIEFDKPEELSNCCNSPIHLSFPCTLLCTSCGNPINFLD